MNLLIVTCYDFLQGVSIAACYADAMS